MGEGGVWTSPGVQGSSLQHCTAWLWQKRPLQRGSVMVLPPSQTGKRI